MITFNNFYISTIANYKSCRTPKRTTYSISDSGNKYWYHSSPKGDYVIILSNHWCNVKETNFYYIDCI